MHLKLVYFCFSTDSIVRPKIWAFVPRRENRVTQWTSPATRKRVYCRLLKPGDSDLLGGRAPRTANLASFYRQKTTLSAYYIRVTKWLITCLQSNPIGTNFAGYMFKKQSYWYNFAGFCSNLKQFYWYKQRGLLFNLMLPRAFQLSRGLFTGCILISWLQVTRWGRGIPPFHGKPKPKSRPPVSPSPSSPT